MQDLSTRIAAAKTKVEGLKNEVAKAQEKKLQGYTNLRSMAEDNVGLGPQLKIRRILKGHFGKVYAMHWSGNSKDMASASQDGKLIIWDASLNIKIQAIPLRSSWVMTCAFEQSTNSLVACGGLDNICTIYKLNQAQVTRSHRELSGHDGYLSSCRFISTSDILTCSGDTTCMLWDVELGQTKMTFSDHDADVMSISISPDVDPNMFISGSCDSLAKVWDVRTGKCTMTLRGHESDINSVCLFPDGKSFGSGSDDSTCRYWDLRSCGQVSEFKNDMVLCGITSCSFSKSGRILFAGYDDYNCLGWDVLGSTDKHHFQLQGHENRISCLGVAPNGDALCTGSWDTVLKIWA
jgi:guanine nucleotide-binding protein G(I)/G(S)/G(T) subunit beta-1